MTKQNHHNPFIFHIDNYKTLALKLNWNRINETKNVSIEYVVCNDNCTNNSIFSQTNVHRLNNKNFLILFLIFFCFFFRSRFSVTCLQFDSKLCLYCTYNKHNRFEYTSIYFLHFVGIHFWQLAYCIFSLVLFDSAESTVRLKLSVKYHVVLRLYDRLFA